MRSLLLALGIICFTLPALALPIHVDPAGPTLTGTYAVEWNTDANFENWTSSQTTSAAVAAGRLTGISSGTDPQIILSNLPGGPDLDLGFNDYLETRIQIPAAYLGDIQIFYGTTAKTGFDATRAITIPSAIIPKDGAFHVYRIDVGPEPWWRSTLRDLRIDPVSTSGQAFAIDYLRVGDLPGDVYLPNTTDQPVTAYELSSKHFRFIWNAARATTNGINATIARGSLRNAEEAWQTYVKLLGYREPAESTNLATRNGNKYKVNFLCTFDGFWMGGSPTSFAYLNIDPSGLQVDPPTWVIPHELMHVFQMHNTSGNMPGEWWETHANYGRERWLYHYSNLYPNESNIEAQAVRDSHFMMSSGRNYYLTWPFFLYLDENPDALPDLYDGIVAKMWQETRAGEFPTTALDRLTPTTSLKDIVGYYARRGATFDYARQSAITSKLNAQDSARNARHIFTDLVRRPDAPAWWRVPIEKAPAQGAYAIHELVPTGTGAGRVVTVNLRGLVDAARGADWRASFIAVNDAGAERYTPLWSSGVSSITLAANENKLYLSVAGTPDLFYYGGHDESVHPFRSHPSRSRFHYEVQVTGATPRERANGSTAGLIQHPNGGGWRSSSATVDATAFIGPDARVLGSAQVRNNARVEDFAVVQDTAQILNNAIVSGHAWVRSNAIVRDYGRVRDWAIVDGGTVSANARVLEHATSAATLTGTATAKGSANCFGGTLSGNAIVDGDYSFDKSLSNGVTIGHLPYVGIPDSFTRATPAGLYAAYDFAAAHDSRVLDQFGVTEGYVIGSPAWIAADARREGFLQFNGTDQYAVLERSVADTRAFTFSAWVKPLGGSANQAVLWLGATPSRRLYFTPDDGAGHARFAVAVGGTEQTLVAPAALDLALWSHVAITLDGITGTLYVNGVAVASAPITLVPDQLLAANTARAAQHNYLARAEGNALPMFRGALDDVRFYTTALSASDIAASASLGSVASPSNAAPSLSALSNQTINPGGSASLPFTIADADTPAAALTVSVTSSNRTLIPATNISLTGTGSSRTLNITATPGLAGSCTINVLVSDGALATTGTFLLTVNPPLSEWRLLYFQTTENTGNAADNADPDLDGKTNLEEYLAGTNPTVIDYIVGLAITSPVADPVTVATTAHTLLLATSITKSGPGTPVLAWSKLSGPGGVTFTDAGATFSAPGTYVLQATATLATASASATRTVLVAPPAEFTFRQGENGYSHAATTVRADNPTWNSGARDQFLVGRNSSTAIFRSLLSFDLSAVPDAWNVQQATLELWTAAETGTAGGTLPSVELRTLTSGFTEGTGISAAAASAETTSGANWNRRTDSTANLAWDNPGGHAGTTVLSTLANAATAQLNAARTFSSTTAFVAAAQEAITTNALHLVIRTPDSFEAGATNAFTRIHSDDSLTASLRPRLRLTGAGRNPLPTVNPGTTPQASEGEPATLVGTVSAATSSAWSLVSGPGSASFSSPNTPVTAVTFNQPGNYLLGLAASNASGGVQRTLAVQVQAVLNPARFADWQSLTWPGLADTAIIGPAQDPDGDSSNNLLEWALHLDPVAPDTFAPALTKNGSILEYTYTRRKTAPGAAEFRVEWSDTLTNDWSITNVTQSTPVSLDATSEQVTATVSAGSGPARFVRLRITTP